MFQPPSMILSLVLASIYALLFLLWQGRNLRDFLWFWLAAVVGFAAGQLVGQVFDLLPWTLGQVHIIEATVGALLFLILARVLRQARNSA